MQAGCVVVGEHDLGNGLLKPPGSVVGAYRFPPIVPPFCRRPICCHLAIRAYYYRTILSRAHIVDRRRRSDCQNDHCAVIWIVPDGSGDGTRLSSCSFDQPASSPAMIEFFIGYLTSVWWRSHQTMFASFRRSRRPTRFFSGKDQRAPSSLRRARSYPSSYVWRA